VVKPERAQDLVEALAMIDDTRRVDDKPEMQTWLEELADLLYELED